MFTIVASITTSCCASPTLPRIHQRRVGPATTPDGPGSLRYGNNRWTADSGRELRGQEPASEAAAAPRRRVRCAGGPA